ncbi:MAG: threonine synthase, partial [Candidatus Latescibacteria bacterium]|nr:threonine synthase [Candidatus Latescibacterota bacterium]
RWCCDCGGLLDLIYDTTFNRTELATRPSTLWRYREALPIQKNENIVTLDEGFTPLTELEYDDQTIFVKQEHLFPTGSYKDRGASLVISQAKSLGIDKVVEDSSGNAGAAIAAYCARAGIACDIYVPESTSPAKLAQIQLYGATLYRIPGTREDTSQAVQEAAQKHFYASHVWNPFFFHGTKTFAFEVWEQLGFQEPDALLIPTGNGTLLIGAYTGFRDLLQQQLIRKIPKLVAVQSTHCAPIKSQWDTSFTQTEGETVAEGIAIAKPARAEQMLEAIKETGGDVITVTDAETLTALKKIAKKGFYVEPTSATALAAVSHYKNEEHERIVVPLTGHGLKATEKMLKAIDQ